MRPDLISDLYAKEAHYGWHVSKREMVRARLDSVGFREGAAFPGEGDDMRGACRGRPAGLDLGAGGGYSARSFEPGRAMTAADVSHDALRFCRRPGRPSTRSGSTTACR